MEDFIELGIEGIDKIVDGHFHKLPNETFLSETYNPRRLARKLSSRHRSPSSPSSATTDSQITITDPRDPPPHLVPSSHAKITRAETRDYSMSQDPRQSYSPSPRNYNYMPPYSQHPPQLRPEYVPTTAPYFAAPPSYPSTSLPRHPRQQRRQSRDYGYSDDDEDGYYSDRALRRPSAIPRRSSSYHGSQYQDTRDESPDQDNRQLAQRGRRRRGSDEPDSMAAKTRDVAHRYGLKDEVEGHLSKSKMGLAGAAAGALVGGWATQKAQVATGRHEKKQGSNKVLTLLGAAAGGLLANVVIEKYEESRVGSEDEGSGRDDRGGRDGQDRKRDGRSRSGRRDRRRRRSDSDDDY